MKRKCGSIRASIGVLAALASLAGMSVAAQAQDVFKLGVVLPLSGPAAKIGNENLEAINLAFDEINSAIAGTKIELVVADDQNNPNAGLTETRRLVENDKVQAVIGTLSSAVALAIHPYTTRAEIPYVTGGIARDITESKKSAYTFRSSLAAGQQEAPIAAFLIKNNWKSGVLMGADYAAGHDAVTAVGKTLKALGGTVLSEMFPRFGETDYAPFFSRIDPKAEFVYGYFFGGDTLRFIRAYRSFGLKQPLMMTGSAVSSGGVAQALGESIDGLLSAEIWVPSMDDAESKQFVEAYTKKFGHGPESLSYDGYIKAKVIIEALKSLNGKAKDGKTLAAAIEKVDFPLPGGRFHFDKNHNPYVNMHLVKWKWIGGKAVPEVLTSLKEVDMNGKPTR